MDSKKHNRFVRAALFFLCLALVALTGCETPPGGDLPESAAGSREAPAEYSSDPAPSSSELSSAAVETSAEPESSAAETSAPVAASSAASSGGYKVYTGEAPALPSGFQSSYPDNGRKITSDTLVGVWLAYYEITFQNRTEQAFEAQIDATFADIAALGCNTVFCHVRPYADAYYPSKLFPWSSAGANCDVPQGTDPGYDPLAVMIRRARAHNLQIHAWINPYRVALNVAPYAEPWSALAKDHPVRLWKTDGDRSNDDWAIVVRDLAEGGGPGSRSIFLNPAVPEVQKLILDGIREILENYDVDGIHFDDYFYPTTAADFDAATYAAYCAEAGENALPLDDWRRANVNALVSGACSLTRSFGKVFGISPAAAVSVDHTDRNYTELYADVTMWMASGGYVDYIMPQLYFGFEYPNLYYRFDFLLNFWSTLPRNSSVKLYIGLPAYKIGTEDAKSTEWKVSDDILARQAELSVKRSDGFVVFSYSSLSGTELRDAQRKKLVDYIRKNTK